MSVEKNKTIKNIFVLNCQQKLLRLKKDYD